MPSNSSPFNSRIIKMDAGGNRLNSISIGSHYLKIMKSANNYYYLYNFGSGGIMKLNSSFNYITSKYFSLGTFANNCPSLIELSDSTLLLASGSFFGDCYIDKFDKNLNALWHAEYGPQIGEPVSLALLNSNTVMVYTNLEDLNFNNQHGLLTIDTSGTLIKSAFLFYGETPTDNASVQTDTKNGKFYFTNAEIVPPNIYANWFNIYCTDSSLSNMCNSIDTTISFSIIPPDFQDPFSIAMSVSMDSLINDVMSITNVSFVYGECSDTTLSFISTSSNELTITVYPNPMSNEVTVRTSSDELKEFILRDIFSKEILREKFTNSVTLNTEKIAAGIYIYEVRNRNKVLKKGKVVKD